MDPNEALRIIRALVKQLRVEDHPGGEARPEFVQHARDLAEHFEGLDGWLSRDGFLPADWRSDDEKAGDDEAKAASNHPRHTECADGCGIDVTHNGACLDKPGGRQVCTHETGTCRHCGRSIVLDPEDGWVDLEAGTDRENGDGMWREGCDSNHDSVAGEHEPEEDDPHDDQGNRLTPPL